MSWFARRDRIRRAENFRPIGSCRAGGEFDLWREPAPTPDVTGTVMERLGFERISTAEGRRTRRQRSVNRAILLLAVVGSAAIGIHFHQMGLQAQRAGLPSFNEAIPATFDHAGRAVKRLWPSERWERSIDHESTSPAPRADHPRRWKLGSRCSRVRWSGLL